MPTDHPTGPTAPAVARGLVERLRDPGSLKWLQALAQELGGPDAGAISVAVSNLTEAAETITRLEGELVEAREALVEHNGLVRSAFQAAQRDAIADVEGTTNYRTLADRAHDVLTKYHAVTNTAREAVKGAP